MVAPAEVPKARCTHCRSEIAVLDQYAHGDHIKCGACGTKHKVIRGDKIRLVLADATPVREALAQNEQLISRLEDQLARARGSLGIGANGTGLGVIYAIYQVALKEQPWSQALLFQAIAVAVVTGGLLEAANYLFLSKRQAITRFSEELQAAREESVQLRQKIREAGRV